MLKIVRVGAVDYSVECVERLCDCEDETMRLSGQTQFDKASISIDAGLCPQRRRLTLWHELVHIIIDHAGHEQLTEPMIHVLSYGIVDILKNNPELARMGGDNVETA